MANGISFNLAFRSTWQAEFYVGKPHSIRPLCNDGDAEKGGIRFDIVWGMLVRPLPYFWKRGFWTERDKGFNPWHQFAYWAVLRCPIIGFFFSAGFGWGKRQPGLYIGLKQYTVNYGSCGWKDHDGNLKIVDGHPVLTWPTHHDIGKTYLCPSMSMRSDIVE